MNARLMTSRVLNDVSQSVIDGKLGNLDRLAIKRCIEWDLKNLSRVMQEYKGRRSQEGDEHIR